jgi:hypothetical protein
MGSLIILVSDWAKTFSEGETQHIRTRIQDTFLEIIDSWDSTRCVGINPSGIKTTPPNRGRPALGVDSSSYSRRVLLQDPRPFLGLFFPNIQLESGKVRERPQ